MWGMQKTARGHCGCSRARGSDLLWFLQWESVTCIMEVKAFYYLYRKVKWGVKGKKIIFFFWPMRSWQFSFLPSFASAQGQPPAGILQGCPFLGHPMISTRDAIPKVQSRVACGSGGGGHIPSFPQPPSHRLLPRATERNVGKPHWPPQASQGHFPPQEGVLSKDPRC